MAQWLVVAGAGMLQEEMWDVDHGEDGIVSKQELFQLWMNLPSQHKMTTPRLSLLNSNSNECSVEDTSTGTTSMSMSDGTSTNIYGEACDIQVNVPIVEKGNTKTHVFVGEYDNSQSRVETFSPMSILHVQMEPGSSWDMNMPSSYKTGILYMRQGSGYTPSEQAEKQMIDAHYTATLTFNSLW